jgi:hypothetical protein|tara:strand:+ start:223 stop:423 length:201 start_codon:yes stop_codon:yes gene_type:complete
MVPGDALPWVLCGEIELLPTMFDFLGPSVDSKNTIKIYLMLKLTVRGIGVHLTLNELFKIPVSIGL